MILKFYALILEDEASLESSSIYNCLKNFISNILTIYVTKQFKMINLLLDLFKPSTNEYSQDMTYFQQVFLTQKKILTSIIFEFSQEIFKLNIVENQTKQLNIFCLLVIDVSIFELLSIKEILKEKQAKNKINYYIS